MRTALDGIAMFSLLGRHGTTFLELSSWPFLSAAPVVGIFGWINLLSFARGSIATIGKLVRVQSSGHRSSRLGSHHDDSSRRHESTERSVPHAQQRKAGRQNGRMDEALTIVASLHISSTSAPVHIRHTIMPLRSPTSATPDTWSSNRH